MADNINTMKLSAEYNKTPLIFYLTEGFFIMSMNGYLCVRIFCMSALRSQKEFVIMGGCVLFDTLFGATYFTSGVWRSLVVWQYDWIPAYTRWQCFLTVHVQLFTLVTPVAGYVILLTSLDRFFCVFYPVKYIKTTVKYAYLVVLLPYIVNLVTHVLTAVTTFPDRFDYNQTKICLMNQGVNLEMYISLRVIRVLCSILCVIIYIPVFVRMWQMLRQHHVLSGAAARNQKNLFNMTRTTVLITSNTIILFTIPDVYTLISPVIPTNIFYIMNLNKGVVNFLVFLITQKTLRQIMHRRKVPIVQVRATTHHQSHPTK